MNTNISQGRSWVNSGIHDLKLVLSSLREKHFSIVAFRSQFAVEKLNKAILCFFGIKIEKTHFPTKIIHKSFL